MSSTSRGRPRALVLAALVMLLAGCGSSKPAALKPMQPEVPADLCATVPDAAKTGLVTSSTSDSNADPTAACSLRSADGSPQQVHAVITWTQLGDDDAATGVYDSQCSAVDRTTYKLQPGFSPKGADKACAATATTTGAKGGDSTTMAAVKDREVVTVRYTSDPAGDPPSLQRATQMLEGVLASVAG